LLVSYIVYFFKFPKRWFKKVLFVYANFAVVNGLKFPLIDQSIWVIELTNTWPTHFFSWIAVK
jgi:hypothetical protein